jgi:hypothetical protein
MPRFAQCTLLVLCMTMSAAAVAQNAQPARELPTAVITGPDDIAVGRTLVLDASGSRGLGEETTHRWYRDSIATPISRSVEAVFTPDRAGVSVFRLVVSTVINGERVEVETEKTVTVYRRKVVLIADSTVGTDKLTLHAQAAVAAGVYLRIMHQPGIIPLDAEKALTTSIAEHSEALIGAEAVILWTEGLTGIQALSRALEDKPDRKAALGNQSIVMITEGSLQRLARTVRGHFGILRPARILVTRKEAINPLLSAASMEQALPALEQRDIDVAVVDETTAGVRPWNLLSTLVNYMLTHGVPSQTVTLLLLLPLIATILAFLKQALRRSASTRPPSSP